MCHHFYDHMVQEICAIANLASMSALSRKRDSLIVPVVGWCLIHALVEPGCV